MREMAEEPVAQAVPSVSAFDESGNVSKKRNYPRLRNGPPRGAGREL